MWDRHPVRLALLHMLPNVAEQRGVALTPLMARAGLAAEARFTDGIIVSRAQVCTLLLHLGQRAGEPTIGIALADAADPIRLGLSGRALFTGRTLRDCLVGQARQMPGLQGGVGLSLEERDGVARWHHRMADSTPEHAKALNEGISGFMVKALKAIAGIAPDGLHVGLPHRAQAPLRIYEDALGARVTCGAGDSLTLTFDAAWLDRPNRVFSLLPGHHPQPANPVPLPPESPWLDDAALLAAISRLFESIALSGPLSLVDTARSLGMSPRSLQRSLARLGTSFEAWLDTWRREQARIYLADATLSVTAVARSLGYGHPAHFIRAFRRWEGATPLGFRQTLQAEGRVPG